jgi:hypothetical protein
LQESAATTPSATPRRGTRSWAFYSFREDSWDGNYELGSEKVNWKYWVAIDANKPDPVKRKAIPEFEPVRKRLQP